MLSKSSVEVGVNVGELLSDNGVLLSPKQGTLLAELTNAVKGGLPVSGVWANSAMIKETLLHCTYGNVERKEGYIESEFDCA